MMPEKFLGPDRHRRLDKLINDRNKQLTLPNIHDPSIPFAASLRFRKRSMRPPRRSFCCFPVYTGWQLRQVSTVCSFVVLGIANTLPHVVQVVFAFG